MPAGALCHEDMGCKAYLPNGTCVTQTDWVFDCKKDAPKSSPDGVAVTNLNLQVGGVVASGSASIAGSTSAVSAASDTYASGSLMTVTFQTHWAGNASHPAALDLVFEFGTGGVEWLTPPGADLPKASGGTADPQADSVKASQTTSEDGTHVIYTVQMANFAAPSTYAWSFRIPAERTQGTVSLPVTLYVLQGHEASAQRGDMAFPLAPASSGVVVGQPIWQSPAFLLLGGAVVGLAVGFVLFRKGPRT
ncbi:MAG: hypothetical protein V4510_00390 [bacterium]